MKLRDVYRAPVLADSLYKVRAQIKSAQNTEPAKCSGPLFSGYGELHISIGSEHLPKEAVDEARASIVRWLERQERKIEQELHELGVWNTNDVSTENEPVQPPADGA